MTMVELPFYRMTPMRAQAKSLTQRKPRDIFECRLLIALPKARRQVEELYGIRINKIPSLLVSNSQIFPDRDSIAKFYTEQKRLGWIRNEDCLALIKTIMPEGSLLSRFIFYTKEFIRILRMHLGEVMPPYTRGFPFPLGTYYCPNETITIPKKRLFEYIYGKSGFAMQEVLSHELTHHAIWEARSRIYLNSILSRCDPLSLCCANEGLARYSEDFFRNRPEATLFERIASAVRSPFRYLVYKERELFNHPVIFTAKFVQGMLFFSDLLMGELSRLLRHSFWGTEKRFANAADKNIFARQAVDPYRDGLKFVRHVAGHLKSPSKAFKLITQNPPQSMSEVLLPDRYLERVYSEK